MNDTPADDVCRRRVPAFKIGSPVRVVQKRLSDVAFALKQCLSVTQPSSKLLHRLAASHVVGVRTGLIVDPERMM